MSLTPLIIGSLTLVPAGSDEQHVHADGNLALQAADGDLIFETGGSERGRIDVDGAGSGIFDTPTVSELFASTFYTTNISATTSLGVGIAPFGMSIVQASITPWNGGITADDTNYWTVELLRWRNTDGVLAVIATKTTKVTGGAGMTQRADWNFDSISFDATNKVLPKGSSFGFRFTPSGSPSAMPGVLMAVRYEPT